ncbi:hypothetical protein CONPUDRAFT_143158 [Coniophora puteana RWD-64-598 SS2]|uniref:Cation/H+ exchanger transmembrane domain-containing protein n=1 Tax=Coniophora puteana (strain RWD-64-598) TaxID=741705 RepID=A0A5M3MVZ4_CONPW|nr:uncharacterized protein CONPUDRAFT_143158 [Coniophora puteana RWD-64-598 SS2]EIW83167.1 hypothetical protein CONPUDRAFT_143158 [Coniophora puteana RWD-64-598 SS2]
MRVVLAFGLFSIGVALPAKYMWDHLRGLLIMVVPTMALGWLSVAACLTPTDPVTCAMITGGKFAEQNVNKDIRDIISAESAANDGLAYPFLSIAIYLTIEASAKTAIWKWVVDGIFYQVVLGTLLGAFIGFLFSKTLRLTKGKNFTDRQSFLAQYMGLSLFTMGVASTIGVDDLLASFAAGCAIAWDENFQGQTKGTALVNSRKATEAVSQMSHFSEQSNDMAPSSHSLNLEQTEDPSFKFASVIEFVLNCGCFIYIGAWLPFNLYTLPEVGITPAKLVALMIAIIFLRRIPCLLLLFRIVPEVFALAIVLIHLGTLIGPMGVSVIFVSTMAVHQLAVAQSPQTDQAQKLAIALQPIVFFVVLGSIVIPVQSKYELSILDHDATRREYCLRLPSKIKSDVIEVPERQALGSDYVYYLVGASGEIRASADPSQNVDILVDKVTGPHLAYICIGGFVVLFSLLALIIKEKLYINEVILGTAFGVLVGPYVANAFNPRSWGPDSNIITLEFMRIVLATGLFAIGVELPGAYMLQHAKGLLIMVVPTMAFGWLVGGVIVYGLFPQINFISGLCIAACFTPTDPVTAAAITGGKFATKHVPLNLRRLIQAESASNDGLAYPFLSISVYLTLEASTKVAIGKWFLVGWLYQVILGTVLGAVLGLMFSKLLKISHGKGFIDRESFVSQYLAFAIFTIGVASTIGADDLLAAFAAGSAISWDEHFNTQIENESFTSVIEYVLNCGCFIYIGAWLPFDMYNNSTYDITPARLVVLVLSILILRRIPPLLVLYKWVPEIDGWKEALFCGHFGPMGVSAIFVATYAVTRLPVPQDPPQSQAELLSATIQPIVSFVVLGSIIVHGLSIPFFNLGRGVQSRTTSLTVTWTNRAKVAGTPDWLLWAKRPGDPIEGPSPETIIDPEQGLSEAESKPLTLRARGLLVLDQRMQKAQSSYTTGCTKRS